MGPPLSTLSCSDFCHCCLCDAAAHASYICFPPSTSSSSLHASSIYYPPSTSSSFPQARTGAPRPIPSRWKSRAGSGKPVTDTSPFSRPSILDFQVHSGVISKYTDIPKHLPPSFIAPPCPPAPSPKPANNAGGHSNFIPPSPQRSDPPQQDSPNGRFVGSYNRYSQHYQEVTVAPPHRQSRSGPGVLHSDDDGGEAGAAISLNQVRFRRTFEFLPFIEARNGARFRWVGCESAA